MKGKRTIWTRLWRVLLAIILTPVLCTPQDLKEIEKVFGIVYDFDDGIKFDKLFRQMVLGSGYYNIPHFFKDGMRLNFGIGYPF